MATKAIVKAGLAKQRRTANKATPSPANTGKKVDITAKIDRAAKKSAPAVAKTVAKVADVVRPARTNTYMTGENRKAMLDGHLLKVLKAKGINGTSRAELARAAGCSNSLLRVYYPGGVEAMRTTAVVLAATAGDAKTVKKAMADGFPKSALPRKFHALVK